MNLAVAFTEYQLLQVQALIEKYNLKETFLVTFDRERIPKWLVEKEKFTNILYLPNQFGKSSLERISKAYIKEYDEIILNKIPSNVNIFIGAQDENTIYSLLKYRCNYNEYWNIEDGYANYYERDLKFKNSILAKKLLFKYIYGYPLEISYGHGMISAERAYRVSVDLSNKCDNKLPINFILKDYLEGISVRLKDKLNFLSNYKSYKTLVITDTNKFKNDKPKFNSGNTIYKFHPRDDLSQVKINNLFKDKMPLELVPYLLPNINTIKFEVMSSSILNLYQIESDVEIKISFEPRKSIDKAIIDLVERGI